MLSNAGVLQTRFVPTAPSSHRLSAPVGSPPTCPLTTAAFEYGTNFAAGFQERVRVRLKTFNISESFKPKGESSSNRICRLLY